MDQAHKFVQSDSSSFMIKHVSNNYAEKDSENLFQPVGHHNTPFELKDFYFDCTFYKLIYRILLEVETNMRKQTFMSMKARFVLSRCETAGKVVRGRGAGTGLGRVVRAAAGDAAAVGPRSPRAAKLLT